MNEPKKKWEHKPNSGSAFKNRELLTERDPMYRGSGLIGGKEYWISIWQNQSKNGVDYFSLSFNEIVDAKPKVDEIKKEIDKTFTSADMDYFEDEIPF